MPGNFQMKKKEGIIPMIYKSLFKIKEGVRKVSFRAFEIKTIKNSRRISNY